MGAVQGHIRGVGLHEGNLLADGILVGFGRILSQGRDPIPIGEKEGLQMISCLLLGGNNETFLPSEEGLLSGCLVGFGFCAHTTPTCSLPFPPMVE